MKKNIELKVAKKFLFIYSHVPCSEARTAGQVTAWRNLSQLMSRGEVDVFLAVNSSDIAQLPACWPGNISEVAVVPVNLFHKILAVGMHFLKYSPRFSTRLTFQAKSTFKALVEKKLYDEIWIECTEGAVFLDLLTEKSQTTIYAQDVLVQASLRSIGINKYFSFSIFKDENKFLSKVDRIIVPSGKDAELIKSLYSISNVSVAPPALSQFIFKIDRMHGGSVPYSILFWGAMSRPENYSAIIKFLDFEWNKITQQFPASVLYIVGSSPPSQLLKRASDRVIVTGYLDDPSIFFEKASIGIVPLQQGAGVKVKVLEMLEAGIPVISTPVGAEGVKSNPLLRVVDFDEISDAVISFFKDMKRSI